MFFSSVTVKAQHFHWNFLKFCTLVCNPFFFENASVSLPINSDLPECNWKIKMSRTTNSLLKSYVSQKDIKLPIGIHQ